MTVGGPTAQVVRSPTYVALVVSLVGPPAFVAIPKFFEATPGLGTQIVLQLLYCGLAAFVLWIVIARERLPLRSIGLRRPSWSTLVWGILLYVLGLVILPTLTRPLLRLLGSTGVESGLGTLAALPAWFRVVLGITGGVVEETLYRGYAIERLEALTGRLWLAATISVVVFALAHVPAWGLGFALAADLPFGILMTLLYVWKRDLVANALAHSTGLVVAMLNVVG